MITFWTWGEEPWRKLMRCVLWDGVEDRGLLSRLGVI